MLVIDEAYGEFSDHLDERLFDLAQNTNTVILRTLSKAYGLAGMRVGWGVFPRKILPHTRKLLNPNNVSVAAQKMAAAAMLDQAYMQETCQITARLRDQFIDHARSLGIIVQDSHTNFVLLELNDEKEADELDQFLRDKGILMRAMRGYGLGHCLRATIINQTDLEFVMEALSNWRAGKDAN